MNANVNIDMQNDMKGGASETATTEQTRKTRALIWLLRRELWENRSIYIAPAAVAVLFLVAAIVNMMRLQNGLPLQELLGLQPGHFRAAAIGIYAAIVSVLAIVMSIVTWFYLLDALFTERRDRSVLFWKSLPVSDATTVLSKMLVAQLVIPLVAMVIAIALYILLMLAGTILLLANGVNGGLLIGNIALHELIVVHLYVIIVASLWYAPVNAWLLFVSSWVRRAPFVWALLIPAGLALFEYIAFSTKAVRDWIGERFSGGLAHAFDAEALRSFANRPDIEAGAERNFDPNMIPDSLIDTLAPGQYLSEPGLWIGLVIAGALIAATIWMRRYREPL